MTNIVKAICKGLKFGNYQKGYYHFTRVIFPPRSKGPTTLFFSFLSHLLFVIKRSVGTLFFLLVFLKQKSRNLLSISPPFLCTYSTPGWAIL